MSDNSVSTSPTSNPDDPSLLPYSLRWTQLAVSPDMMERTFCNPELRLVWRSSLAIAVSEDDRPSQDPSSKATYPRLLALSLIISNGPKIRSAS